MTTQLAPALGSPSAREKRFDWPLCYEAENFVLAQLHAFLQRNSFAKQLEERMRHETGTLLLDWADHLVLASESENALRELGYTDDPLGETPARQRALWHPEAMLPRILLDSTVNGSPSPLKGERAGVTGENIRRRSEPFPAAVAIRAESVSDFIVAQGISGEPEGDPLSRFRRILVSFENSTRLEAVERRGYRGYRPARTKPGQIAALVKAHELWKTRPRDFDSDQKGYEHLQATLDRIIGLVGRDLACQVVFAGERAYWQGRNRAAQIQKMRQDRLGLGWANHDHHTFRSSRRHFLDLMAVLDKLGFERRERYYAGAQAGWGAQILEQPVEGIVAFWDVNLQPEETEIDFSRRVQPSSRKLGTIGLWVGLHGESLLQAGMHHLECRFDHALLRDQLAALHVGTMKPFSDFPFLKQAFTEGERWPVRRDRAERLLRSSLIDQQQFNQFMMEGAIGSHLENLQRKGGFKGFNQKSVSVIIQATDPRTQQRGA